jgi:hypothetical protein
MRSIRNIVGLLLIASAASIEERKYRAVTVVKKEKPKSKEKSKKGFKAKPNGVYKSTKPVKAQSKTKFRNKSNL